MEPFIHLPEYPFAICQQWSVPPPTTAPIPFIPPPKNDGLGCDQRPYVVRQFQRIRQHYEVEHRWVNPRKRGRVTKVSAAAIPPVPWRTGVQCQRFFRNRVVSSWFEVGRSTPSSNEGPEADHASRQAEFVMTIQRQARHAFESEAEARIQDASDKWEAERWLKRTGWPAHLAHIDRTRLREQVLQPIGDKESVYRRCGRFSSAYWTTRTAELFEIERKEVTVTPNKPFEGIMEPDAWVRYKEQWRIMMCTWVRLESWGKQDKVRDSGDAGTDDMEDTDTDGTEDTDDSECSDDTDDSEYSNDPDDQGGGQRKHRNKKPPYCMTIQQEQAWAIFKRGVTQVVTGTDTIGRFTDERLERALAVMGLDANGGWVTAANYTPVLSAIVKGTRYLVLYQSVLERHDQITRLQQTMSKRRAKEKADGLFRIIREKVWRFMTRMPDQKEVDPSNQCQTHLL
ncbi:hypothetical protein EDB81DRAFT_862505 [Dactylonectria macrodidyma]|uniref:Uncharacterized protein n=1 Tax=Dactylonectria macrodidyma TaxID=307937 RepID=A0A9P9IB77_9HYPO|nr:hypothetical protein EDB81DRAFT_862505 [Dactylonectria macrodidyma]